MNSVRGWRRLATALGLVSALAMAACGGDDDSTTGAQGAPSATSTAPSASGSASTGAATAAADETTTVAADDYDPGGVLRVGATLDFTGGLHFDPTTTVVTADEAWITLIYGTLVRPNAEGGYDPWLAESIDVVDPTTISVKLRDGITFSDGTPYDAEAVRGGILRNLQQSASPAVEAGRHGLFRNLADVIVDGPLGLTFTLSAPVAGEFVAVFAGRESAVPSPKAIADGVDLDATPVGAGPYLLDTHKPSELVSLRRNPDFFDADRWKLAGIDFVHATQGPASTNALLAEQIDDAQLTVDTAQAISGDERFSVLRSFTEFSYLTLNFCSTQPPFDNELVRKAVQLAIDRDTINRLYLQGTGAPAYGFWPEDSANFASDLVESTKYDLDEAKRLMSEAGVSNLSVELYYSANPAWEPLGDLLQAQLGAIGIDATITGTPQLVEQFIAPKKPGAMFVPGSRAGVDKVLKIFQPGTQQNLCDADRTDMMALANQVAATAPDDPQVSELWKEIDLLNAEHAYVVFLVQQPSFTALNTDRVGGELFVSPTRLAGSFQSYENLYIKA